MVGVLGGAGSMSEVGAGFTLGAALSWEVTPSVLVRAFGSWDQTQRARGRVSYTESGQRRTSLQSAEWLDFTMGAGAAYLFHVHPGWAPYAGGDVGVTLIDGFEYRFEGGDLEGLIDDHEQPLQFDDGRLLGRDVGAMVSARGGVRMHLAGWLASMVEVSVSYVRNETGRINNTLTGPDVRSVAEDIWLVRGTFSVRLGL